MYLVSIPKGIDVSLMASQLEPSIKTVDKALIEDKLKYLISLIYRKMLLNITEEDNETNKIYLHSTLLKNSLGKKYKAYLEILEHHRVILRDDAYSAGRHSKGIRFNPMYMEAPITRVHIKNPRFTKKLTKDESEKMISHKDKLKKAYPELYKNIIAANLSINKEEALKYIKGLHRQELLDHRQNPHKVHPDHFYEQRYSKIMAISERENKMSVDKFGRRAHYFMTNLDSDLRKFITLDGEPLVSLDLKNSQPYLLNILLKDGFLTGNSGFCLKTSISRSVYTKLQGLGKKKTKAILKKYWIKGIGDSIISSCSKSSLVFGTSMLGRLAGTPENKATKTINFSSLVQQGVYEFFMREFPEAADQEGNLLFPDRETTKTSVLKLLYRRNKGWRSDKLFKAFYQKFPEIATVLIWLKMGNHPDSHKDAPKVLQRIESHIFLKLIAPKLDKAGIPFLTIHDSFLVTERHHEKAHDIMFEVLKEVVGVDPVIKVEYLN
ncbi:MAG: hypothetical protein KDC84_08755 [Crocinitomicaceae bacterium]|nr:hypothetical protein [Crocinitomicaceae bacterium]